MKSLYPLTAALLCALTFCNSAQAKDGTAVLEGPYLGQKPPGLKAEPFAPGIVNTKGFDDGGVFTPDMNQFYFLRERQDNNKLESVVYKRKNNRWIETIGSQPQPFYPAFAPDGKTMHLGKHYKKRTGSGWSERKKLGAPFDKLNIMSISSSLKGTWALDERDDGILRYSRLVDGKREAPKPFPKHINTGEANSHPFIAPDESYMIWDGTRDGGLGSVDIYISFRQPDGSWGDAINMGDKINSSAYEAGAKVTPDGKYLFFVRNMGSDKFEDVDIYWADARLIDKLRPKHLK